MTLFAKWNHEVELASKNGQANEYLKTYYNSEKEAYDKILQTYPSYPSTGTLSNLAAELGFEDLSIFVGFLEGLNTSLEESLNLDSLKEDTLLNLKIDFTKLYYNMHDAKATWLYSLESWDNVLSITKRNEIAKTYRVDNTAVSQKVGRNEPCTCGSNKKFKNCCGK